MNFIGVASFQMELHTDSSHFCFRKGIGEAYKLEAYHFTQYHLQDFCSNSTKVSSTSVGESE